MAADVSHLRRLSAHSGLTLCEAILRSFARLSLRQGAPWRTLLAVSANSQAVVEAALLAAKEADCPIFFAATLNQVDPDGGYTGWTHARFAAVVRQTARKAGFKGPVLLGVDHAGPWLRDRHTTEKWPYRRTLAAVKKSLESAIEGGFDLLHIDPTVDRELPPGRALDINTIVERTVLLIKNCEDFRNKHSLPAIAYEVGTEEVHGGLADEDMFKSFLAGLRKRMNEEGLAGPGRALSWARWARTWIPPCSARRWQRSFTAPPAATAWCSRDTIPTMWKTPPHTRPAKWAAPT